MRSEYVDRRGTFEHIKEGGYNINPTCMMLVLGNNPIGKLAW